MAKRRSGGQNRALGRDRSELNPAGQEQVSSREQLARIPAESVEISAEISKETNDKVKGLVFGLVGLKDFYSGNAENEQFEGFFETNKPVIEQLLKTDLNKTYSALVANAGKRNNLYELLVKNHVITAAERNNLLGVVSNQPFLSYLEELKKPATPPRAVPLTPFDFDTLSQDNPDVVRQAVQRLRTENKITEGEASQLLALGPKNEQEVREAKDRILAKIRSYDLSARKSYAEMYESYNQTEQSLEKEFDQYREEYNRVIQKLVEEIQKLYDQSETGKKRENRLKQLRRQTGLPIKPGQILWGASLTSGGTAGERNNRIEIKEVEYGGAVDSDSRIQPEFRLPSLTLEPVIVFSAAAQDGSGRQIEYKMAAPQFRKWLAVNEVTEKFESVEELEQSIGAPDFIKAGQTLEYLLPGSAKAPGDSAEAANDTAPTAATVRIVNIENGRIYFDHAVPFGPFGPGGLSSTDQQQLSDMDFGQFALWYRKIQAVPETEDLDRFDYLLAAHHRMLIEEMGWEKNHGTPIKLSEGSFPVYLISAYEPEQTFATVTGVNNGLVETEGNIPMKPSDFFRQVFENGFTIPNAEQLEELKQIAQTRDDQKQTAKLDQIAQNGKLAPSAALTGKGKIEEITAPPKKQGYFKTLWENTTFLNLMEVYELLFKAPADRVKEWLKDKSERRVSTVGKNFYKGFPKFGGLDALSMRYEDKLNSKNATDVKNFEEILDRNFTTSMAQDHLYSLADNPNIVQMKACLQFLSKKGVLRWEDDRKLWRTLNAHLPGYKYPDKFHHLIDPNTPVVMGDPGPLDKGLISVYDQARAMIDGRWGAGTFDSMNGANEREYATKKEEAGKNMHKYEFLQGGIVKQLQKMLYDWEQGRDVKQFEFDGLLSTAVSSMEMSLEQGFLFLISAFSVRNSKNGQTLLSYSRLNPYIGGLAKHLLFFYFATGYPQLDEEGNPIYKTDDHGNPILDENGKPQLREGHIGFNNFSKIFRDVIAKDIEANLSAGKKGMEKYTAGQNTIDWMHREVLTNKLVKDKIGQKSGTADVDPAIYHFIGPNIKEESLDRVLGRTYGSLQNPLALKNMYVGYSDQLRSKTSQLESGDPSRAEEFANMIYSFVYFNDILKNRIRVGQSYMRMTEAMYDDVSVADKKQKTRVFCKGLEEFTGAFAAEVGVMAQDQELIAMNQQIMLSGASRVNDDLEDQYREKLRSTILRLAKEKPAELSKKAREIAEKYLVRSSGAQVSAKEMKAAAEKKAA
jgi:hypothetical protein